MPLPASDAVEFYGITDAGIGVIASVVVCNPQRMGRESAEEG